MNTSLSLLAAFICIITSCTKTYLNDNTSFNGNNFMAISSVASSSSSSSNSIKIPADSYSNMSGIQVEQCGEGGQNIGYVDQGDWIDYSIKVSNTDSYILSLRVAGFGGQIQVKSDNGTLLSTVNIPNTGAWQSYTTVKANVSLPAGEQLIRIYASEAGWNLSKLEFTSTKDAARAIPGKIEAEDFDAMNGVQAEGCSEGGQNIGYVDAGDWMDYNVNVSSAGTFTMSFRVAGTGGQIQVKDNNGTVLATIKTPNTGGWQSYTTISTTVTLSKGQQTLRIYANQPGWNLNSWEVISEEGKDGNINASYTLAPTNGQIYLPNGLEIPNLLPGDTINIPSGDYSLIVLGNFHGSATKPIIIRNLGGLVTVRQIRFQNDATYFKFLGNGSGAYKYGFKIGPNEYFGIASDKASDFEIAYCEVFSAGAGFLIKKNPVTTDNSSLYPNYVFNNIFLHHNYIHDTNAEGMYIGHTDPSGTYQTGGLIPVRMQNVEIAYNIINNAGWDGIQLSNATTGNKIHHNTITNYGTTNTLNQQAGIIMGGNTNGDIYENNITNGTGNGIEVFGFGLFNVYNNTLTNTGKDGTSSGQHSIYCNDYITMPESNPKQQLNIYSNTINYPQSRGAIHISAANNNSLTATIQNNKFLIPNAPYNWLSKYISSNVTSIQSGNELIY